jgi:8-oxo-dGTP diphosphatase
MAEDIRYAVAVAVTRDDGLVLAVQRPDEPGEELPGVWGLPATTLRDGESPEDGVRRLGRKKLDVELTQLRALAEGEQQRADYTLHMTVYEASMAGEPSLQRARTGTSYDALDWLPADSFTDAAAHGSLCCELFVATLTGRNTADARTT